jgi:hypothetical protein
MSPDEHHILKLSSQKGRLYYFQGNFFQPIDLKGASVGEVKRGIRDFTRDNKALIASDRADPAYRTPMQMCDDMPADVGNHGEPN